MGVMKMRRRLVAASALAMLLLPVCSFPQAWTPAKEEGEVSLVYQDLFTREHLFGNGSRTDVGHIRLLGLITAVDSTLR